MWNMMFFVLFVFFFKSRQSFYIMGFKAFKISLSAYHTTPTHMTFISVKPALLSLNCIVCVMLPSSKKTHQWHETVNTLCTNSVESPSTENVRNVLALYAQNIQQVKYWASMYETSLNKINKTWISTKFVKWNIMYISFSKYIDNKWCCICLWSKCGSSQSV